MDRLKFLEKTVLQTEAWGLADMLVYVDEILQVEIRIDNIKPRIHLNHLDWFPDRKYIFKDTGEKTVIPPFLEAIGILFNP